MSNNSSLTLKDPQQTIDKVVAFLKQTFARSGKKYAVIAISGGIDSALSATLLARAVPKEYIFPVMLPYGAQPLDDGQRICDFLQLPEKNRSVLQIEEIVDAAMNVAKIPETETFRKGNLMARARMMLIFDFAKAKDALVCGTENKSEHYLGYFTRFGDAASDIEPISHLYKTQVRQLAEFLGLPQVFLEKAPSAGLWTNQTDENELGFTYEEADQVMDQVIDKQKKLSEVTGVSAEVAKKVLERVESMKFKLEVPYCIE